MIRSITQAHDAAPTNPEIAQLESEAIRLRATVENVDGLADEGFEEISSIARLALMALEQPSTYTNLETIARALCSIATTADRIRECVGLEAQSVGCASVSEAQRRRYAAQRQHDDERATIAAQMRPMHVGPT